ncbi:MAG: peptidyl-prolyl cis-trans isomerase [Nitrospirota bacterium]
MQKICFPIAVIICFLLSGLAAAADGPVPKDQPKSEARTDDPQAAKKIVVARVNGAEIMMFDLLRTMNRISAGRTAAPADVRDVRQEALNRLILQELAWQEAQAAELRTKKENIETAIANLKENVGGEEMYRQLLEQEQVTENDLRMQVERSLTLEAIFAKEVYGKISVPDEELKKAYERERGAYIQPEKVLVLDVFIFNGTGDGLREKAESIRSRILADKKRDPWQLVLDGTFIVRNYAPRKEKDRVLFEEAKKLKKDELSEVIMAPDGAHIVRLRDYVPERQLTLEEVRPNLEKKLLAPAQEMRLKEWEQKLRNKAAIEIVEEGSGAVQVNERSASLQGR